MAIGDKVSCRSVLWYLVFVGFAVNFMLCTNLYIAIVSMVNPRTSDNAAAPTPCYNQFPNISWDIFNDTNFQTRYDWDEHQQGMVLSSFFWFHWITQIPGGILARHFGTKLVFGLSNFVTSVLTFFVPLAADLGYHYILSLRAIQGFIMGLTWPSMHHMAAKWNPPNERSKFVSAYMGSSVGVGVTYAVSGFIIKWLDWQWVFYSSAVVGIAWYIAWFIFVYDSPAEHPKITQAELLHIEGGLGSTMAKKMLPIPWTALLTSVPVWMNILAQWGVVWGTFTLLSQSPTYFRFIHGWDVRMIGFVTGFPHITRVLFSCLAAMVADHLLKKDHLPRTTVRKLATSVSTIGQAILCCGLIFCGCDSLTAVIFLAAAVTISGAVSSGPMSSIVDLSPNFASVSFGISSTFVVFPAFLSPMLVGVLTFQKQTVSQWQLVFGINAAMLLFCGMAYALFSSSDLQHWNSPSHEILDSSDTEEQTLLKPTDCSQSYNT